MTVGSGIAAAEPFTVEEFVLPELPYAWDALEPVIDRRTMEIHHGKHHRGYVDKLNAALRGMPTARSKSLPRLLSSLDDFPAEARTTIRNNAGGHYNHCLFWESMQPPSRAEGVAPGEALAQALVNGFGSEETFRERFQEAGGKIFGSGWVWLVWNPGTSSLEIVTTPNQDSPLMNGPLQPLLGNDCWEHAYYLGYQNRRADYLQAWWNVVNWSVVDQRLRAAM